MSEAILTMAILIPPFSNRMCIKQKNAIVQKKKIFIFTFLFACLTASVWYSPEVVYADACSYKENSEQRCFSGTAAEVQEQCAKCPAPGATPDPNAPVNPFTECKIVPSCPQKVIVVPLDNPLSANTLDFTQIIGSTVGRLFGVFGSLSLVVFLYGGFLWLTSGGNSDKVKQGAEAMIYAVVGIFIIFGSYAILNLLFTKLLQ